MVFGRFDLCFSRMALVPYREVKAGFGAGEGADDGGGVRLDGDGLGVGGGELEAVEEYCGALGVDAVAGEGGDEERDRDLDGLGVFNGREVEFDWILGGVIGQVLGGSGCGCGRVGVGIGERGAVFDQVSVATVEARVEVAEGRESERWGLAAFSVGFDVAAGCGWHFGSLNFEFPVGMLVGYPPPPSGVFWE